MIVADASILANVVGDDGDPGRRHRAVLTGADGIAVPDLAYVETMSVLRRRWLSGDLTDRRFSQGVGDLLDLPLDAYGSISLMPRILELRSAVTAYDAVYVALAEALDAELVTADRRLSRAPGLRCPVKIVE